MAKIVPGKVLLYRWHRSYRSLGKQVMIAFAMHIERRNSWQTTGPVFVAVLLLLVIHCIPTIRAARFLGVDVRISTRYIFNWQARPHVVPNKFMRFFFFRVLKLKEYSVIELSVKTATTTMLTILLVLCCIPEPWRTDHEDDKSSTERAVRDVQTVLTIFNLLALEETRNGPVFKI
jgi:hypothetical protein